MANRATVLILDDGELGNIHRMLQRLGVDVERMQGDEIGTSVPTPRDLLITSGRRTLREMPELAATGDANSPIWVCVHSQDFLPMRERLCEMGVHYLLQNALDEQSRERFMVQLLRRGAEQRSSLRLHLGGEVRYRADGDAASGRLVELSLEGCRILTRESFESGTALTAILPPALGGGRELELGGIVLRESESEVHGGHETFATVIQFGELGDARREQLAGIVRGEQIGTKITPLASVPDKTDHAGEERRTSSNRRAEIRHGYRGPARVLEFGPSEADPVLGCDLSLNGIRLSGCHGLASGAGVTVALFGTAREEPTVLSATVVRTTREGEAALTFDSVSQRDQQAIEKLLRAQPLLDALDRADSEAGRTIVAEIRTAASA